jgi:hypothetical protein
MHEFQLSQTNPVANPVANRDQCDAEECALRLLQRPEVQAARQKAAFLWRLAYGEDWQLEPTERFEQAMDEYAFNYVLKATASDAQHPRFVRNFMPPHQWFGRRVPGARMGGDNPDNCYRLAGIAHGSCYEVSGRAIGRAARSITFTLVANWGTSVTVQTLDHAELECVADGSFTLVIDAEPAAGRRNHLRTAPGVKFLFVRDSMEDWAGETPLELHIRKLDAPAADPLDDRELAERAAFRMAEDVPLYYWFTRLFIGRPANSLTLGAPSGALGGLVAQAGAQGRAVLGEDQAAVVRVDPAGAAYSGIVAQDWWFRTLEYWNRSASMTTHASIPDADGTITYVISARDPGVHNWIDTCGRRQLLLLYRWQGLPREQLRAGPAIEPLRVVAFDALAGALSRQTVTVTAQERRAQIERRAAGFARRVVDR